MNAKVKLVDLMQRAKEIGVDVPTSSQSGGSQDWEQVLQNHVAEFNKTHAQVLIGGKHRIMRTTPSAITHDNRESFDFFTQKDMELIHQASKIQVGMTDSDKPKPIYKNHFIAWATHENSSSYIGGVVFKPNGKLPPEYFNTWRGFTVEPKQNSAILGMIWVHINDVICGGDDVLIDYVYDWIAYTVQNPDKPAGSALVCRGEKGSGKGTIGHFLAKIWGNHALHISNSNHLTGNFNGHLSDVCFLFADEAYYSANKSHESVLKALITEPTLTIERKGVDAISQPNYLKVFMATNSAWAVPASKDERRYMVLDVRSDKIGDKEYFDSLHKDCNNREVQAAFLYEMLSRDISSFHSGKIPDTDGLKAQRMESLGSAGKWLVDSLNAGYFETKDAGEAEWVSMVSSKTVFQSYLFWCDHQKVSYRENQTSLGRYLSDIGYHTKKSSGIFRVFGEIDAAIEAFESFEKVKI